MYSYKKIRTKLGDGQDVEIRPIEPDDKTVLRDGLQRLSATSRYRRFMAPIKDFTEAQLRYLTEVDYVDHMAWVAMDLSASPKGLGVARYVRDKDDPDVAEAAVTVVDSHHNLGLGTMLLRQLACSAKRNNITHFRGYVLQDNKPMLSMLADRGASIVHDSPGIMRVETEIPDDIKDLGSSSTSALFRAIAKGKLPSLALHFWHGEIGHVVKIFSQELYKRMGNDDEK